MATLPDHKLQELIKNERLHKQQILMYQKVMDGIRQDLKFKGLLKLIIRSVCRGLGFKRAGIFLMDTDGKSVRLVMGIDKNLKFEQNKERIPINQRPGKNHFADVINGHKKYFFSNDIPHRMTKRDKFRVPVYNNALVPLRFGKAKAIGALAVDNLDENRTITKSDVLSLMSYATQVGLAIDCFKSHERMIGLSFTDPMTGLYNRRFFDKALAQEINRCQRYSRSFSLLIVDIDRFKKVNDTYGHDAGDAIIRQVADVLQHNLRSLDVVCRVGGEEFAIILPETPPQNLTIVVNRLLREARQAEPHVDAMVLKKEHMTVSIGVASFHGDDIPAPVLFKLADKSLYQAKRTGRDKAGPHYDSRKISKTLQKKAK